MNKYYKYFYLNLSSSPVQALLSDKAFAILFNDEVKYLQMKKLWKFSKI